MQSSTVTIRKDTQNLHVGVNPQRFFYQAQPLDFEEVNGHIYANMTAVFKANGARIDNWRSSETTRRYIQSIALNLGTSENQLVISKMGSPMSGGGTWIHERLILNAARYISADFELFCDEHLFRLIRTGRTELVPDNKPRIPQTLAEALYFAAQQAETIEAQQRQLATAAPKLATYDAVMGASGNFSMQEAAKALGVGPKQIFAILRQKAILYFTDGHNIPYQKYIDRGWFVVKMSTYTKEGVTYSHPRIHVTPKGVAGLNDLLTDKSTF